MSELESLQFYCFFCGLKTLGALLKCPPNIVVASSCFSWGSLRDRKGAKPTGYMKSFLINQENRNAFWGAICTWGHWWWGGRSCGRNGVKDILKKTGWKILRDGKLETAAAVSWKKKCVGVVSSMKTRPIAEGKLIHDKKPMSTTSPGDVTWYLKELHWKKILLRKFEHKSDTSVWGGENVPTIDTQML